MITCLSVLAATMERRLMKLRRSHGQDIKEEAISSVDVEDDTPSIHIYTGQYMEVHVREAIYGNPILPNNC